MSKMEAYIRDIRHVLETEYYDDLCLSDMAARYYTSPSHLSEAFRRHTGHGFSDYLNEIRITRAMAFMTHTDMTTEAVADMVGYHDRAYFSRVFTRRAGMPPSVWRKRRLALENGQDECYHYVAVFRDDPMIAAQDVCGLSLFSSETGARARLDAPPDHFDPAAIVDVFHAVLRSNPAGIMVCGCTTALVPAIDEAVERGIPVVTVDTDLPESKRIATVGSDWGEIARLLALQLATRLGGKGTIALFQMGGDAPFQKTQRDSFLAALVGYPGIRVLPPVLDGSVRNAAAIWTERLLDEGPGVDAFAGFDSNSALGICDTLRDRGLEGRRIVVSVDMSPPLKRLLENGEVAALVGQRRELFTYYGGRLLHDVVHPKRLGENLALAIPARIDTGLVVLTQPEHEKTSGVKDKMN